MSKPVLWDLFCGAGGAGMGYHRAGFEVIGVDISPQPDYPFRFIQQDAIGWLRGVYKAYVGLPDVIHASPPCQSSTALTKGTNKGREYPDLIPETRELLALTGLPTIIENVQGSALRRDLTLCGEMFGLGVIRHRYFEVDKAKVDPPKHVPHRGRVRGWRHGKYFDGPYVAVYGKGGGKASVAEAQEAMGIDWTDNLVSLNEAIPPAYTEYIGTRLLEYLTPNKEGDG
ncbi:DNA methyltransferase [Mycobacterium phage HINdeR]|uniref:DNA methyltransferase n=1 Tax=Mycobacterium phage HINdeR TaxID=1327770 RepID=R4JEX8_9CAUD|nr:DNA methyltransferase [Mycobacterium phage HINdeR]AGK87533.1 DNA methyltransferase [Mycobacterium phage HINdeR]